MSEVLNYSFPSWWTSWRASQLLAVRLRVMITLALLQSVVSSNLLRLNDLSQLRPNLDHEYLNLITFNKDSTALLLCVGFIHTFSWSLGEERNHWRDQTSKTSFHFSFIMSLIRLIMHHWSHLFDSNEYLRTYLINRKSIFMFLIVRSSSPLLSKRYFSEAIQAWFSLSLHLHYLLSLRSCRHKQPVSCNLITNQRFIQHFRLYILIVWTVLCTEHLTIL